PTRRSSDLDFDHARCDAGAERTGEGILGSQPDQRSAPRLPGGQLADRRDRPHQVPGVCHNGGGFDLCAAAGAFEEDAGGADHPGGAIHREMVESLSINVKRYFLLVFMLGAALAALAGVLFAPYSGAIYAEMGMEYAILAFIVVVVGGLGSVSGSALAALMVGLASAFMNYFLPDAAL